MANPLKALQTLFAGPPLQVGDVVAVADAGTTIALPDSAQIIARGAATVGQRVFVRGGLIEGAAPDLPIVEFDI